MSTQEANAPGAAATEKASKEVESTIPTGVTPDTAENLVSEPVVTETPAELATVTKESAPAAEPIPVAKAPDSPNTVSKTDKKTAAEHEDLLASEFKNVPYTPIGKPKISKISHNGASFKVSQWDHAGKYLGTILVVHGFAENSILYVEYLDRLSQKGFDITFFDQRGAGETSPGKAYGKTEEVYQMGDVDFFLGELSKAKPNEKFFLLGHSMGVVLY